MATPQPARTRGTSRKAIASLVLALIGLFVFPIILSLVAVVLGWLALRDIDRTPGLGGRGLAIAGLVIGAIGVLLGIVSLFTAARRGWLGFFLIS